MMKWLAIGCGSTLLGIGINGFILPMHILNGGFIGLALLLNYTLGVKVGLTIIILSAPVFLLALRFDKSYFFNSLFGMLISSIIIDFLLPIQQMFHLRIFVSALIGGSLIGTGIGIMMRHNTCVGGLDLLALLLSKWYLVNAGFLMIIMDAVIISAGMIILHDSRLLFSFITILTAGAVTAFLTSFKSIVVWDTK
ncbi:MULTISPECIES: YitT family protein [unclassified Fictibacillus]|uniref:YitT family protein n=1 Tax=unclassified Fictibacillus TaxID=2644029 RepID=UPI000782C8D8|nr:MULTISPECIES: YitT family protein [unclassified Fictibacillus]UZJ76890.1 YitT family protein [Fictibacillus sp. KU28468]